MIRVCPQIKLCDANEVLPFAAAKCLLAQGASIAHVADFVRILAASRICGWIIDCDNIWIRNPPSQSRYAFATLGAYVTGAYKKPPEFWKECQFQIGKEGYWDGKGLINFPCLFEPGEAYAVDFAAWVEGKIQKHQTTAWPKGRGAWNMVMWAMKDFILKHELQQHVHPFWHFSPAPAMPGQRLRVLTDWFDKKAPVRTRFGVTYPSTDRIKRLTYCVSVFFNSASSAFGASKPHQDQYVGSIYEIIEKRPQSLLAQVWEIVEANTRRARS